MKRLAGFVLLSVVTVQPTWTWAQERPAQPPQFVSPEVSAEKKITFRIHAPKASAVRLTGSYIPGVGMGVAMKKAENGVWDAAVGPVPSGAYRYNFNVDGVPVIDPRNPSTPCSPLDTITTRGASGSPRPDTSIVSGRPTGSVSAVGYVSIGAPTWAA